MWYLANRNGLWQLEGDRLITKVRSFPSKDPISSTLLSPNNIIFDFEANDPTPEAAPASPKRRTYTDAAVQMICKWEGYHRALKNGDCEAYPDPAHGWDVATIGYGTTSYNAAGRRKFGRSFVGKGDMLTKDEAVSELKHEVDAIDRALAVALTVPVTQAMYDALVSFAYNVGISGASMQIGRVNKGDYKGCADAFDLYVKAAGRVLPGLINRRNDEEALFRSEGLDPEGASQGPAKPTAPAREIRLVKTSAVSRGLVVLEMHLGTEIFTCFSGQPSAQSFRKPSDPRSRPGNMEPIPQGTYRLGPVEWAGGKGNWSASWGAGLGPVWISLTATFSDDRSAFGIHLDSGPVGSAGCVVLPDVDTFKRLLTALDLLKPTVLVADWGL